MMPSLLLTIAVSIGVAWLRWQWQCCPQRAVVANVFLCALVLNYVWEITQMPLFDSVANTHFLAALRHCAQYGMKGKGMQMAAMGYVIIDRQGRIQVRKIDPQFGERARDILAIVQHLRKA